MQSSFTNITHASSSHSATDSSSYSAANISNTSNLDWYDSTGNLG